MLSQILLVIRYNKENGVHNLVEIIQDLITYTEDCIAAPPQPRKPAIYNALIDDDEKALVCAQKKATHKARRRDFMISGAADCKAGKFIISVVEDTWLWEIKRAKMY